MSFWWNLTPPTRPPPRQVSLSEDDEELSALGVPLDAVVKVRGARASQRMKEGSGLREQDKGPGAREGGRERQRERLG